ncbi:MAG: magnesium and cobalt transport protein CorA [Caldithrix sp. RBG_13_44_9]|nr:MAG: magnesium and cobalt transport protein CorA [Caldithrix sp. RBG_13_44_9]
MTKKFLKKRSKKMGLSPGTMIYVGEAKGKEVTLSVIDYNQDEYITKELRQVEDIAAFRDSPPVTWLNVTGLQNVKVLEKLGEIFNLHPLIMEDILNTDQRPKVEIYDDYLFIVLKIMSYDKDRREISSEQVSIILGNNYIISFLENQGDLFLPVKERIKNPKGRHRTHGADYLAYALIDIIVDHYFLILENLAEELEILEENAIENSGSDFIRNIQLMKRELIYIRKSIWPVRELIGSLFRGDSSLITDFTKPYLKDVYDHTIQIIDTIENFRDIISGILDIYLTKASNRMNEIMKVLTVIATIFIPLTFIVGIYGMNFEFMPELKWRWAYPSLWMIMLTIFIGMIVFFRKKKWI